MNKKLTPILLVIFVAGLWVISGLLVYEIFPDWPARGAFGDMFGSINSLFSGLALAGVIYALILQQKELALQREELKLTRNEVAASASSQKESAEALKQQFRIQTLAARTSITIAELNSVNEQLNRGHDAVIAMFNMGRTTSIEQQVPGAKDRLTELKANLELLQSEMDDLLISNEASYSENKA